MATAELSEPAKEIAGLIERLNRARAVYEEARQEESRARSYATDRWNEAERIRKELANAIDKHEVYAQVRR